MFKVNTLIAAYQFGKEMKETSQGKDIYEGFYGLKDFLSKTAWSIYREVVYNCQFDHYFSFEIAYKKIELSQEENNASFKNTFIEMRDCSELHSFIKLSNDFARNLEDSYIELTKKLPMKSNGGIIDYFPLYRSWLDLFYNFHNTKFYYNLHSKIGSKRLKDKTIQEYFEQREMYPFSSINRRLIRSLAKSERDLQDLWTLEYFESIRKNVFQLIFETHLDIQLEINKVNEMHFRESEIGKIRACKIKIHGLSGLSRGNFMILYLDGKLEDIGLIQSKTVFNLEKGEEAISIITALLYPKIDKELLVN
ncbi:hypothetical protein M1Q06_03095 [Planococcus sp. 11815]|uniref:hypothetical protein n=1 Tax=Planococcus sp. 11815 TaxID=2939413 RepID=UPI003DA69F80